MRLVSLTTTTSPRPFSRGDDRFQAGQVRRISLRKGTFGTGFPAVRTFRRIRFPARRIQPQVTRLALDDLHNFDRDGFNPLDISVDLLQVPRLIFRIVCN